MSEVQIFLLAISLPLAFLGISLNQILRNKLSSPKLGLISFLYLFMVNPPN